MSMSWYEAEQEQAYSEFFDSLASELYGEHKEQAIKEFVTDRLASFYRSNGHIAQGAVAVLEKAKLHLSEPTASLLFSSTATEVILKSVLLKPVVYGLVHTEALAELIASELVKQAGIDRFKMLIFKVLEHYIEFEGGVGNYCRKDSDVPLWKERESIQAHRNRALHQAKLCTEADARLSIEVAMEFMGITAELLSCIGFEFSKDGTLVCRTA